METISLLAGITLGVGLFVGLPIFFIKSYFRAASKRRNRVWSQVAERLNLDFALTGASKVPEIRGEVDGAKVFVTERLGGRKTAAVWTEASAGRPGAWWRIQVSRPAIPSNVALSLEGLSGTLRKLMGGSDHQIADRFFDDHVLVRGDELMALALLDRQTRQAVHRLFEGTLHDMRSHYECFIKDGEVFAQTARRPMSAEGIAEHAALMIAQIEEMVAVSARLELAPDDIASRLAANAENDSRVGVCFKNFEVLEAHDPPAARACAERLITTSAHPRLRIHAATRLGAAGVPALLDLVADDMSGSTNRAEALTACAGFWAEEGVAEAVRGALKDDCAELRAAALACYSAAAPAEGLSYVEADPAALALIKSPEERVQLATLYGHATSALAEARLIPLLKDPQISVRVAAAQGLGRAATITAVESLLPLTKGAMESLLPLTKGVLQAGGLKDTAKAAIAAIQSRTSSGGQGQLSVSTPGKGEGALSLDEEQGKLSVGEE